MSNFRIVLLKNGEYQKTIARFSSRNGAFIRFHKMKKENNRVLFPKRFLNSHQIKPVNYELAITKPTEPTDKQRVLRDELGRTYLEPFLGDWTIVHSAPYKIEETFQIYGITERHDLTGIMKRISKGAHKKDMVRLVIVVVNKLVIYNEDFFELVICKCMEDAQRLHHTLHKACKRAKIGSFMFMGTANEWSRTRVYDVITRYTGWSYRKIIRGSTRH